MGTIEDIILYKLMNPSDRVRGTTAKKTASEETFLFDANTCFDDLHLNISVMERTRNNLAHRPVICGRKYIGKIVIFGKKVIRKLLKWYINPFAEQQLTFNNGARYAIGRLTQIVTELFNRSEKVKAFQETAEVEIEKINDQVTTFFAKFDEFEWQKQARTETEQQMLHLAQRLADLEEKVATGKQEMQKSFLPFEAQVTNSQSGEDSIVAYVAMELGYQPHDVTYLDLGANHAKDMSNTYRFYQYGARGVLVEANPELIPELQKYRSGDVILNKCVAEKDGQLADFFVMSGDGLSTKNENSANSAVEINPALSIKEKLTVETISVNTLMEQYFEETPVLLNIDLEGCEMEVLPSIDFEKHRPLIIIVETIPYQPRLVVGQKNAEVIDFMNQKGYTEYAFTGINSIFIDRTKLQ